MKTPLARRARGLVVVSLPLVLLAGFSRPLAWKGARGTVSRGPDGVTVAATPFLALGENPDNQGCLSVQRLDAVALVRVTNATQRALPVHAERAIFSVDGAVARNQPEGEPSSPPIFVQPGKTELVGVRKRAFLPKSDLVRVERIEVVIPAGDGEIRAEFAGLGAAPEQSAGNYPAALEAEVPP
jgi:hypothetical protein